MDNYYELQIKINPEIEDIVSEFCFENLPCEGVLLAEEAYKDLEMISTTEGTLKVFLTEEPQNLSQLLTQEREILKSRGLLDEELGSWEFVISNKPNEDWSKKWKEKWTVTKVSDRITVVPDWIDYAPQRDDEVIIKLEPGCAFGTGTHQTTQLCMKAIEKYMPQNALVADIGMGSGILAICAKKFGASFVYGCDNDETVIDVAKENAVKNNAECSFELNTTDKITDKFDGQKTTMATFATHDQQSPMLIGGENYWDMVLWLTATLPLNSYFLDGFPTGDTYIYKYENQKDFGRICGVCRFGGGACGFACLQKKRGRFGCRIFF